MVSAVLGAASLIGGHFLVRKPLALNGARMLPWWDIPVRMIATAMLVAGIAVSNDYLGATLSGIVSSYPVILTVVATFTHHRWGVDAVRALLRGVLLSLLSFVAFFWTVSQVAPYHGMLASFSAAAVVAVAVSAMLIASTRWYATRPAPPTGQ